MYIQFQRESEAGRQFSLMQITNVDTSQFSANLKQKISSLFSIKISGLAVISDYSRVRNWYQQYQAALGAAFRVTCHVYFLKHIKEMYKEKNEFKIKRELFQEHIQQIKNIGVDVVSLIDSPIGKKTYTATERSRISQYL